MICEHMKGFIRIYADHPVEITNVNDTGLICQPCNAEATPREWSDFLDEDLPRPEATGR